ncbi:haloacid dehalogenase type II [Castellaniella sp.]|uniref:haloacid dehalogenase type II n=1 Tax=Castellaniella sp. TaxID=1955812 RepID=UPI0025C3D353|nr:haloacid dehalogenase type II [Castellaniella sp.]
MNTTPPTIAVFDAYGTLFDVHSAVARLADTVGPDAGRISELWRQKQLEYTWTRSLMQRYADFWQVTEEALDHALASFGRRDEAVRRALLDAYQKLDAYPDVREALDGYRRQGLRVAVFSNATTAMLSAALNAAGLDDLVDTVYSVHALEIFKPDVRVYAAAAKAFGVAPSSIAFHSSNGWDAAGAASCGWRALWINRAGRPQEYPWMHVPAVPDLGQALAHVTTATVPIFGAIRNAERKDA